MNNGKEAAPTSGEVHDEFRRRVGEEWPNVVVGPLSEATTGVVTSPHLPGVVLEQSTESAAAKVVTNPKHAHFDGGFRDVDAAFGRITVSHF